MKAKLFCSLAIVGIATVEFLSAPRLKAEDRTDSGSLQAFAREATSENSVQAGIAIKALRTEGPAGLKALSEVYSNQIAEHLLSVPLEKNPVVWERIRKAFDKVGEQRDCYVSQLYWYTNLDEARAAAHSSGKPILSLRLLGKLNEEYSCANSRFFRTTLYANAEVAEYLHEHFILHWQSVRPAPRIIIDMGDGRKIERTITGNSIHYILDPDGRPIDALPGLYGAKVFLAALAHAADAEHRSSQLSAAERETFLKNYHQEQLTALRDHWAQDLKAANVEGDKTSEEAWRSISCLHHEESRLDSRAYQLASSKQPTTLMTDAMHLTVAKCFVETPMTRMVRNLESSIAEDTVRNEYQMHSRIHEWLASAPSPDLNIFNRRVYAELFLTPDSDPWLGLAPADIYSGLDNAGLIQNLSSN